MFIQSEVWQLISNQRDVSVDQILPEVLIKNADFRVQPQAFLNLAGSPDPGASEAAYPSQLQRPPPRFFGKSYYPGPYFPIFLDDKGHMVLLLKIQVPGPHPGTTESGSPGGWGLGSRESGT